ncbi:MAG: carboxymuconolactone decarboxylase family protein [Balneola sp.]
MRNFICAFVAKPNQKMNNTDKNRLQAFREERAELNEKTLNAGHLGIKRFFNMDANTYRDGALDSKTKELLGLVASSVLRCNDCIDYHLEQCAKTGSTKEEILDAMNVALIVGGSIVIPHLRRAVETIEMIEEEGAFQKQ